MNKVMTWLTHILFGNRLKKLSLHFSNNAKASDDDKNDKEEEKEPDLAHEAIDFLVLDGGFIEGGFGSHGANPCKSVEGEGHWQRGNRR